MSKLKFNATIPTNGKGHWTDVAKPVRITGASVYVDFDLDQNDPDDIYRLPVDSVGQLNIYFSNWNTTTNGLIYTDPLFLKGLVHMFKEMGFNNITSSDISYSEQGMQGRDYVSLDVGYKFLKKWYSLGFPINSY